MRKVYYGRFVDFMPPTYDYYDDFDDGLIGGHIYVRNAQRASLRTAGYEYYTIENGHRITIDDANILEKIRARFIFMFSPRKKKVLGTRSSSEYEVSPYSDPAPQLGICLDSKGRKTVDHGYYSEARKRGKENDNPRLVQDADIKEKAAIEYVESLAEESYEDKPKVKKL